MKKAKLIQVWGDVDVDQSWDRDSGLGEISGSTTFWGLFDDGKIRYWQSNKWKDSDITTEIEVSDD